MNLRFKSLHAVGMVFLMLLSAQVSAFAKADDAISTDAVLILEDGEQRTGGIYTAESDNQSA